MPIAISLDWETCRDGVELFDYGPGRSFDIEQFFLANRLAAAGRSKALSAAGPHGVHVRWKSTDAAAVQIKIEDAGKGCALEFINARSDSAVLEFINKFGLPAISADRRVPLASVRAMQNRLDWMLRGGGGEQAFNSPVPDDPYITHPVLWPVLLPRQAPTPPVFALATRSLYEFMQTEVGLLVCGDSRVASCAHCGRLFSVGEASGKRRGSVYCSPAHRQAAHRKKVHKVQGGKNDEHSQA